MEELQVFNEQEVLNTYFRMFGDKDNPLFLAKDVAEWIDYAKNLNGSYQVNKLVATVDQDEKLVVSTKLPHDTQVRKHTFLTKVGLIQCLTYSRTLKSKQLLEYLDKHFNINKVIPVPKEIKFEQMLQDAIKYHLKSGVDFKVCPFNDKKRYCQHYEDSLNYETQYSILNYRVDFYFPNFNLIVEYDEKAHEYQKEADIQRQFEIEDFLNKQLGNKYWEDDGSLFTFIRVKEGQEFKGIIEIITHLMSVFIF